MGLQPLFEERNARKGHYHQSCHIEGRVDDHRRDLLQRHQQELGGEEIGDADKNAEKDGFPIRLFLLTF